MSRNFSEQEEHKIKVSGVFARRNGIGVSTLQYWLRRAQARRQAEDGQPGSAPEVKRLSLLEVELAAVTYPGFPGGGCYELEEPRRDGETIVASIW